MALLVGMASLAPAQTVDIPDPGLHAAIRTALNKPTGDITIADMESLTVLDGRPHRNHLVGRRATILGRERRRLERC